MRLPKSMLTCTLHSISIALISLTLLTKWNRIVLEKTTVTQVLNKCQTITVISLFTSFAELVFHLTTKALNLHRFIYLRFVFIYIVPPTLRFSR